MRLEALWAEAVERLQTELSTPSFETWVRLVSPVVIDEDMLTLAVPNEFTRNLIATRYQGVLHDTLLQVSGGPVECTVTVDPSLVKSVSADHSDDGEVHHTPPKPPAANAPIASEYQNRLNPKYLFTSFVVGGSNRFAHAACQAVAEMPARAYNPLFLYGGVGLGKTHLMHAIGHQVLGLTPTTRVLYVSAETFTNEMINSIRDDRMVQFRHRYREIDILLIDDIQFVAGKERTQEEFFHTFEALHGARKQIVISSDRPPRDIPTLEERLRSRFEWGLISDIQPPDLETRIAILGKKAQLEGLSVVPDVLQLIASRVDTNIRELEGALIRVVAFSSIHMSPITLDLATEALKDMLPQSRPRPITIRIIQEEVAKHYEMRTDDFKAKKRTRAVAFPRQVAMYLARQLTGASLPKIGEEFGGRDHTTVIHACTKISQDRERDAQLAQTLDMLARRIRTR
jgi:chromosomal replication initiator protein